MTTFPIHHGMPIDQESDYILGKMAWLRKYFPEFLTHFYVGPTKHFVAGPHLILIDDCDLNINLFEKYGGKGILLPRINNSNWRKPTIPFLKGALDSLLK